MIGFFSLIKRYPITTYTFVGLIRWVWVSLVDAQYDASVLFWIAVLFGLVPSIFQETGFSLREWFGWPTAPYRVYLVVGLLASLGTDRLGGAVVRRLRGRPRPDSKGLEADETQESE